MILTAGDALLTDIISYPDDDGLRLIYADWCEENGQVERAEFIRVQIALAKWSCECNKAERVYDQECRCKKRGELRRRQRALFNAENLDKWGGHHHWERNTFSREDFYRLHNNIGVALWVRGFVSSVRLPQHSWLVGGSAIVCQHPIGQVVLSDREPVCLARGKAWARVALGSLRHHIDPRIFDYLRCGNLSYFYLDGDEPEYVVRIYQPSGFVEDSAEDLVQACLTYARSMPNPSESS